MTQPAPELADMITKARAQDYQVVRSSDGNGWTVTTSGLKQKLKFEGRWRVATHIDLARLLARIVNTKVGTGYSEVPVKPRRETERPAREADKSDPWAKPRRRGSLGVFDLPSPSRTARR